MLRVPQVLSNQNFETFESINFRLTSGKFVYISSDSEERISLLPHEIEKTWLKLGRPEPKASVIRQGRFECAPASVAMLMGLSLFEVKRAFAKTGWNNDDRGISLDQITQGVRLLGGNLEISETKISEEPSILLLDSLNMAGMKHVVCWNGEEILDPNFGNPGRNWWGPEWSPETINPLTICSLRL